MIIGFLARLVLPGRQSVGAIGTVLAGVGGALIAGFIGNSIAEPVWVHIVVAIVGAAILVGIFNMLAGQR